MIYTTVGLLILWVLGFVLSGWIGDKFGQSKPSYVKVALSLSLIAVLYASCQQPHLPPLAENFNSPYPPELYQFNTESTEYFGRPVIVYVVRKAGCAFCGMSELETLLNQAQYSSRLVTKYYDVSPPSSTGSQNQRHNNTVTEEQFYRQQQAWLYSRIKAQIAAYGQTKDCRLPPGSPPDIDAVPYFAVQNERGAFEICGVSTDVPSDPVKQKVMAFIKNYVPTIKAVYGPSAELDWPILQGKEQRYWLSPKGLVPSYPVYIPWQILGFKNLETGGGVTPFFNKKAVEEAADRVQIPRDLEFFIVKPANSSVLVRGPRYEVNKGTGQIVAPPGTIFNLWVYDNFTKTWLCPVNSSNCVISLLRVVVFTNAGPKEGFIPIRDLSKGTSGQRLAAATQNDLEAIPGAPVSAPTVGAQPVQAAPAPVQAPEAQMADSPPRFAWLESVGQNPIDICSDDGSGVLSCAPVPSSISHQAVLELESQYYRYEGHSGRYGKVRQVVEVQGVADPNAPNFKSWSDGLNGKLIPEDNLKPARR